MNNKTFFTHNRFPNFHIEINSEGVVVWVSLNIEPDMRRYLDITKVYKAEKFHVYVVKRDVDFLNYHKLKNIYEEMMKEAMIDCREAKKKVLDEQIEKLMCKN